MSPTKPNPHDFAFHVQDSTNHTEVVKVEKRPDYHSENTLQLYRSNPHLARSKVTNSACVKTFLVDVAKTVDDGDNMVFGDSGRRTRRLYSQDNPDQLAVRGAIALLAAKGQLPVSRVGAFERFRLPRQQAQEDTRCVYCPRETASELSTNIAK